ncbi:MAG: hypothetical protein H7Y27_15520 [Gemmatimonadaceae bacterium]|nr:hypothetical protein [Chitinophagaceae bacterium]
MIGIFKQKNPGNALLLSIYGLVIKFPFFITPERPIPSAGENYIYKIIYSFLEPFGRNFAALYPILAFILLFTQATLLNRIANNLKLLPRHNYLVGMSYLLITSLVHEWNLFSAPLIVNSLLIWIWYQMTNLYNHQSPKTAIFNISMLVGILPLIYSPAVVFIVLMMFALILTRPFRITEWMVSLLGYTTPFYFLFILLYLTNQWTWSKIIPSISFHLPRLPANLWITAGIIFMVLPFLVGSYYVQNNLGKMLIQVRKSWSLLLALLIVTVLIILVNPGTDFLHWLPVVVPLAAFHAAAYFYPPGRWFPLLMHWVIFAFVILLNYGVLK